ncbi:hypothetical protein FACS189479_09170 [Spirochaetia bacterium]|nr:hypothetical protein FACS189479_09170 [Spirochaetia bacterium]
MNTDKFLRTSAAVFLFLLIPVWISAEATNYTYNYDYWAEEVASPDAYWVSDYLLGSAFRIGNFSDPQGMFVRGSRIYVCDSGNNRIVQLEYKNGGYEVRAVREFVEIDGIESPFKYPMDLFEGPDGDLYICDTNNQRILHLDREWNYISSILKPTDQSIETTAEFLPTKMVVDFAGRVFVQARNVNKGLMEFDRNGSFTGYMGANKVEVNPIDYVWKMISTKAQRASMNLFIPTEYNNVSLDHEGFIYVTNSSGQTDMVRRLNAMGQDILIRNGYGDPEGDVYWGTAGGISGPSKFIDVAPMDNDAYACLDRVRRRIFIYDFQGNLLYAFGGVGNRKGYFIQPSAIETMGDSLFVLDSRSAAITRFDLTAYGTLINTALREYHAGRYESSAESWEEVLKMNGNYDLAYIGIGRAALRQGEFQKAMKYYKLKHYREGYGKAFQFYRKQWMEENLWKILLVLLILIAVPPFVKFILRIRKEVREA